MDERPDNTPRDDATGSVQTTHEDIPGTEPLWLPADERPPDDPGSSRAGSSRLKKVSVAVLLPLLVAAAAFAAGRVTSDEPGPAPAAESAQEAQPDPDPAPAPLPEGDAAEPVAAVAEALLPSVVQLEQTGGGLGSGVIYEADGYILTAAHVVEGTNVVDVRLSDGRRLEGRVLGSDSNSDIAVVKVNEGGLPAAVLATDIEPEVGQLAVAIGSPFGLDSTVTSGVVSAINRAVAQPDGGAQVMIQTDAPINPGNSGGALADRQGRVIGINSAIRSSTGVNQGVGFAVPIDVAAWVAEQIVEGRDVSPALLGITGQNDPTGRAGALVTSVQSGSAAEEAGIREGDLIVALDGRPIDGMLDLAGSIRSTPPGTRVTLTIVRGDDEQVEVTATLKSMSEAGTSG